MIDMATKKTIVSPDVTNDHEVGVSVTGNQVILIPMAEWKQCAQRGVRTFMQSVVFLLGGGTVAALASGVGIPPASVANLPSTGQPVFDAILYSLVFGLVVFVWNACEFGLDIDIHAPGWRA